MAICKTRFITTDEIKSYTPISKNVPDIKFEHNIEYVQISSLRPILSESLYDEIDAELVADTVNASKALLVVCTFASLNDLLILSILCNLATFSLLS